MYKWLTILFIVIFCSEKVTAQSDSSDAFANMYGGYGKEFKIFWDKFRLDIKSNDSIKISKQIFYPVVVTYGNMKGSKQIRTRQEFLKQYSLLFDKRMRTFILNQTDDSVNSVSKGIFIGAGNIWFEQRINQQNGKISTKIVTINNNNSTWPRESAH